MSLPMVVHRFKSLTTTRYRKTLTQSDGQPFVHPLWQRNYHEHIIRDEDELSRIRTYIVNNPVQWELDRENPRGTGPKKPTELWQV
jgi:REP element-mobilizing transposase RayT